VETATARVKEKLKANGITALIVVVVVTKTAYNVVVKAKNTFNVSAWMTGSELRRMGWRRGDEIKTDIVSADVGGAGGSSCVRRGGRSIVGLEVRNR